MREVDWSEETDGDEDDDELKLEALTKNCKWMEEEMQKIEWMNE